MQVENPKLSFDWFVILSPKYNIYQLFVVQMQLFS